jgi:cell wall-associated NlpC family hydrolase
MRFLLAVRAVWRQKSEVFEFLLDITAYSLDSFRGRVKRPRPVHIEPGSNPLQKTGAFIRPVFTALYRSPALQATGLCLLLLATVFSLLPAGDPARSKISPAYGVNGEQVSLADLSSKPDYAAAAPAITADVQPPAASTAVPETPPAPAQPGPSADLSETRGEAVSRGGAWEGRQGREDNIISRPKIPDPPSVENTAEGRDLIDTAKGYLGTPHYKLDCSHYVNTVFNKSGLKYGYLTTYQIDGSSHFQRVDSPQAGDIILFGPTPKGSGHMGIVVDPGGERFIGSQSDTGVAIASYSGNGVWGRGSGFYKVAGFYRYVE